MSGSYCSEAFTNTVLYRVVWEVWEVQTHYFLAGNLLLDLFLCKPSPPEAPGSFFFFPSWLKRCVSPQYKHHSSFWSLALVFLFYHMTATSSPPSDWFASFPDCSLGVWWSIKKLSLPRLLPRSFSQHLVCRKKTKIWWCYLCACLPSSRFVVFHLFAETGCKLLPELHEVGPAITSPRSLAHVPASALIISQSI